MAEAVINSLAIGKGQFKGFSAGSHPTGRVNPLALEALAANSLPVDGHRSKSWEEFSAPGAPRLDFVITVCDQAAAEVCPVWPGHPTTAHWGVPDPAAVQGSDEAKRRAFQDTFRVIRRRIELFASLPFDALSSIALRDRIRQIGGQ